MTETSWRQLDLAFPEWATAETTAVAHLRPLLVQAHRDGLVQTWWFVRKNPCWRLRYLPDHPEGASELASRLAELVDDGHLQQTHPVIYEPETLAFGGDEAMDLAHKLFALDSQHLLDHAAADGSLRRELTILLPTALLQGANLDWYEQGDVWARVAQHRRPDEPVPADAINALNPALTRLMRTDTAHLAESQPWLKVADWAHNFTSTGHELAHLTRTGRLHRGLRAVLAHHIVFTWNRHGLPYALQALTAETARQAVFDPTTEP